MRDDFLNQLKEMNHEGVPEIIMMHEERVGLSNGWTVLDLFPKIQSYIDTEKKWIYFCEENTETNLKGLLELLSRLNHKNNFFLGHSLKIREHDERSPKVADMEAGWVISTSLLQNALKSESKRPEKDPIIKNPSLEVAMFFHRTTDTRLKNSTGFCINKPLGDHSCVSVVNYNEPNCGSVDKDHVLISVKTCKYYQDARIPILKQTVGSVAKHIRYYSDIVNSSVPTVWTGVENVLRGHCQKTQNIMKKAIEGEWKDIKWLIIIDDDTIINYDRLLKLLACYDAGEEIILGNRFVMMSKSGSFSYPAGGAGMVLSIAAVKMVLSSGLKCKKDENDDMWVGRVAKKTGTPVVHTNSLHQMPPRVYNSKLLSHHYLVSFHGHKYNNPLDTYTNVLKGYTVQEKEGSIDEITMADGKIELIKPSELVIVIRNQHYKTSVSKAEQMKKEFIKQSQVEDESELEVVMLHEERAGPSYSSWTVLSLLPRIQSIIDNKKKWIYFCEETTEVDILGVLRVLSRYDHTKNYFLGHSIPSPTHNPPEVPDVDAGWAISVPLLDLSIKNFKKFPPKNSFSVFLLEEITTFFHMKGEGTPLTNVTEFCINKKLGEDNCVSTVNYAEPNCGMVDPNDVLISVKTCSLYHKDRIPIIKQTIGAVAKHIRYFSDVVDPSIPTIWSGVENTKKGHCQKTLNIIKKAAEDEWKDIKWLVIIDDDTIINYKRLLKLLACYDHKDHVMLGERFGYWVSYEAKGYSYPTGGGGMAFSLPTVKKFVENKEKCWAPNSPDDMWLGAIAKKWNLPIVHTSSFHQWRSHQYSSEQLSHQYLVSFHKHNGVKPMEVYQKYLKDADEEVKVRSRNHTEL